MAEDITVKSGADAGMASVVQDARSVHISFIHSAMVETKKIYN